MPSLTVNVSPTATGTISNTANLNYTSIFLDVPGGPIVTPSSLQATAQTTVSSSTAVQLRGLWASASRNGVRVRWQTASEVASLGFHVFRERSGVRVRVTPSLIPSKGRGRYAFLDRRAPKMKSIRYWIQEVAFDGSRTWYGPARLRPY